MTINLLLVEGHICLQCLKYKKKYINKLIQVAKTDIGTHINKIKK